MTKDLTKYVTTREAAELLGVKQRRVQAMLKAKRIDGKRVARDWLVYVPSLEKYIATKSKRGRPPSKPPKIKVRSKDQEPKTDGQGE